MGRRGALEARGAPLRAMRCSQPNYPGSCGGKRLGYAFVVEQLVDRLGRPLRDLRVSVTDRCNFRCVYCMPKEVFGRDYPFLRPRGAPHVRGDRARRPRVRRPRRREDPYHGRRAARPARPRDAGRAPRADRRPRPHPDDERRAAGAQGGGARGRRAPAVTVSLDSLDDEVFRAMNDVDFPVVAGARGDRRRRSQAGLEPVKVNVVVKRGVNEDGVLPMARQFRGTGRRAALHRVHGRRLTRTAGGSTTSCPAAEIVAGDRRRVCRSSPSSPPTAARWPPPVPLPRRTRARSA